MLLLSAFDPLWTSRASVTTFSNVALFEFAAQTLTFRGICLPTDDLKYFLRL